MIVKAPISRNKAIRRFFRRVHLKAENKRAKRFIMRDVRNIMNGRTSPFYNEYCEYDTNQFAGW